MAAFGSLRLPATVRQHLFASGTESAAALAAAVAQILNEGLQQRGRASLVVSGGRSPIPFLNELGSRELDWPQVTVTLADERWVPADHADSNEALVRQHLLRGTAAGAHFIPLVSPTAAFEEQPGIAERALGAVSRPFDAVVLGMGDDGHTASLFPGAPGTAAALDPQRPEQVALIAPAGAPHRRISLTLRALLDTRRVMILIQGERKRTAIEQAARADPEHYPIGAFLQQQTVPVHVYYSP